MISKLCIKFINFNNFKMAHRTGTTTSQKDSNIFKWVTYKELLFVFIGCCIAAMLIRSKDELDFSIVLNDKIDSSLYKNGKCPGRREKFLPIVTDLDSDGLTDIVMLLPGKVLSVYSSEPRPSNLGPQRYKYTSKNISLSSYFDKDVDIVAVSVGFTERYQSMVQVRKQVIIVLASDWTVACFNVKLRNMWTKKVSETANRILGEASVLILPATSSAEKEVTTIFIGGRVDFGSRENEDSFTRKRRGSREEYEQEMLQDLGHYTTYAVDSKTGKQLWKHEPGDFEIHPAYQSSSSFSHIKLMLHKFMNHQGEVSWHQYSSSLANVLPHSWYEDSDTRVEVARFVKDRKKTDQPKITEHISKAGDLAMGHLAGYAFGGLRPHSPQEHVDDPNVLVIHSMKGIEVLDLKSGRPLFILPLSPAHAIHRDINGDGVVDHIHAVVNPSDDVQLGQTAHTLDDIDCYGIASPISQGSKLVYRHSICKATHWTESFLSTEKWLPNLNKFGRKKVNHAVTEPFTPVVIESASHQHPLKLASLTRNSSFQLPVDVLYDSVFLLSSGRVTSIGPSGQFNWQVDTGSDWDKATSILYGVHDEHGSVGEYVFAYESFTPTSLPFSVRSFEKEDHVIIIGWSRATIIDAYDGSTTAEFTIPCPPVVKAKISDFTGDGINDIVLVCSDKILGFSPTYRSGFLHKTSLSLFAGLVIVIVAVYTRQRTGFFMPVQKEAQD